MLTIAHSAFEFFLQPLNERCEGFLRGLELSCLACIFLFIAEFETFLGNVLNLHPPTLEWTVLIHHQDVELAVDSLVRLNRLHHGFVRRLV